MAEAKIKKPAKPTVKPATGRRKTAVARVRLISGNGVITVNKKPLDEYFSLATYKQEVREPLVLTDSLNKFDVMVNVYGGGLSGQAGAIKHGIARHLVKADENYKKLLKTAGFLTRDPRAKERKKYGLHKARKASQFSKR